MTPQWEALALRHGGEGSVRPRMGMARDAPRPSPGTWIRGSRGWPFLPPPSTCRRVGRTYPGLPGQVPMGLGRPQAAGLDQTALRETWVALEAVKPSRARGMDLS